MSQDSHTIQFSIQKPKKSQDDPLGSQSVDEKRKEIMESQFNKSGAIQSMGSRQASKEINTAQEDGDLPFVGS